MAFEEIWAPLVVIFMWALFLLPVMYLLDSIRQRADPQTSMKKLMLLLLMSYLVALASYPFAISENCLPFNSSIGTYVLALLATVVVYLYVFNKTKDDE